MAILRGSHRKRDKLLRRLQRNNPLLLPSAVRDNGMNPHPKQPLLLPQPLDERENTLPKRLHQKHLPQNDRRNNAPDL